MKKGFTLIELLAVIIILGVLMLIAVPSVTSYISNSRKNTYLATVNNYVNAVSYKVNSLDYSFGDKGVTYYVPIQCISLEKGGKSPYGNFQEAYVVVEFNGTNYTYYWTSFDEKNMGISLTKVKDLTVNDVKSNIDSIDFAAVGGDTKIGIIDKATCSNTPSIIDAPTSAVALATVANVGDYVNYDAGNWTTTVSPPNSSTPLTLGGYVLGESRNNSVTCGYAYVGIPNGWRVLSNDGVNVKLIHAGISECFYLPSSFANGSYNSEKILTGDITGSINYMYPSDTHEWNYYVNSNYASSAQVFTKDMLDLYIGHPTSVGSTINGSDTLLAINAYYWLSRPSDDFSMYTVNGSSPYSIGSSTNSTLGIRVVVTLKNDVLTSGQDVDSYGNTAWILTQ